MSVCLSALNCQLVVCFLSSGPDPVGPRIAGAAELAIRRVNADERLLQHRKLEYSWANSGCSAQQGLTAMGELLIASFEENRRINALIGPGCSSACEVTSYLSAGQQIPQISWGWYPPHTRARARTHARTCARIHNLGYH